MGTSFHPGWEAGLEIGLRPRAAVTRLTHLRHWGPLRIQRPFYPGEHGECHVYLLHPPGGMVTGDSLDIDISAADGAGGLVTTPSAGKIYRGNNTADSQRQSVRLRVGESSALDWLPLETIAFDGARGDLGLRVDLAPSAHCALWDIVCLGRPASGEAFTTGYLKQRIEIFRDGAPLYLECNRFAGGSDMLAGPWGLGGTTVSGTLIATTTLEDGEIEALRKSLSEASAGNGHEYVAVSCMDGLLAVRYLGMSAERCRRYFVSVLRRVKPIAVQRPFIEPRIWYT